MPPPPATPTTPTTGDEALKVLLLTVEFAEPYVFSGNGVYGRSLVHNLVKHHPKTRVLVICGRPMGGNKMKMTMSPVPSSSVSLSSSLPPLLATTNGAGTNLNNNNNNPDCLFYENGRIEVRTIPLPSWGKLDRDCSWREYGDGVVNLHEVTISTFRPDVVMGVDWSCKHALENLFRARVIPHSVPFVNMVFRVFSETSRTSGREEEEVDDDTSSRRDGDDFYANAEWELLNSLATCTIALSRRDARALLAIPRPPDARPPAQAPRIFIVSPPLREDIRSAACKQMQMMMREVKDANRKRHAATWEKWSSMLSASSFSSTTMGATHANHRINASSPSPSSPRTTTLVLNYHLNTNGSTGGEEEEDDEHEGHHRHRHHGDANGRDVPQTPPRGTWTATSTPAGSPRSDRVPSASSTFARAAEVLLLEEDERDRIYLTCVGRVSPEKETMRFVEMVEFAAAELSKLGVVPYLIGPPTDAGYARRVCARLKRAFPGESSVVVADFAPPEKLRAVFARTVLNFHPSLKEPFGMTVCEAAAFAVPTLMNWEGVGALDLLSCEEGLALGADLKRPRRAVAALLAALRPRNRAFLRMTGLRAREKVLAWGNREHAGELRAVLEWTLRNSFRGYRVDGGVNHVIEEKKEKNIQTHQHQQQQEAVVKKKKEEEQEEEEEDPIWFELIEWAMMTSSSPKHEMIGVRSFDVGKLRESVDRILRLPPPELASLVMRRQMLERARRQQREEEDREVENDDDEQRRFTTWGVFLLQRRASSLGTARYRLVPAKMSDRTFWRLFFMMIKEGVREGAESPNAEIKAEDLLAKKGEAAVVVPLSTGVMEQISRLERLVQRDECGRGIGPLVEALGPGQLAQAAARLLRCDSVVIVTGFPCIRPPCASPQETDGPPGAVSIARACCVLGKRVRIVIEEANASVMMACMDAAFSRTPRTTKGGDDDDDGGTQSIRYGRNGECVLEIYPNGDHFDQRHLERIERTVGNLLHSRGCLVAIERAGPASDGKCYTMRGREMGPEILAPLHLFFEFAWRMSSSSSTASPWMIGIGDGGNEVGMGNVIELIRKKIDLGDKVGCVVSSNHLIVCSVSNWGGYALACAMAILNGNESLVSAICGTPELNASVIEAAVREGGARDGVTQVEGEVTVDALSLSKQVEVLKSLERVVMSSL